MTGRGREVPDRPEPMMKKGVLSLIDDEPG
jgi:hypothetical protein